MLFTSAIAEFQITAKQLLKHFKTSISKACNPYANNSLYVLLMRKSSCLFYI
ncbi:hypothetical protein FDUTEX481_08696 [Tolypothrix sp. PCC 7601]|nr:hypothetical protein FDUTEX481_08696 [Tolypothrix sp. PCC 7601]